MPASATSPLRFAAALGLATALLIVSPWSESARAASVVGPGGQISACYKKKGKAKGTLRVVPAGKRCKKGEKAISWNAQGQGGAQGGTGSTGDSSSLQTRVTDLESQVSQLTTEVNALTSQLSGLLGQVTTLSATTSSLCGELSAVVTETNAILTGLGAPSLTGTLLSLGTLTLSFPSLPSSLSPYTCP